MTNKVFGLFIVGVLALVLALTAVSAVALNNITTYTIPSSVSQTAGSFAVTFNLTNTGTAGTLDYSVSTVTSGATLSFNDANIADGSTTSVTETITATVSFPSTFSGSTISGTIDVLGQGASTHKQLPFTVVITSSGNPPVADLCGTITNPGDLEVKQIDFKNNGLVSSHATFGEDDTWFPFEEVEVEIELENNGDENVDDVSVEWGLWNVQTNQWVIDLDEEDELNIKDGDSETLTVTFTVDDNLDVDLDELTDGSDYRLYVIATGTVDNSTSPESCVSDYETASVVIESDFVILEEISYPESVQCGEDVQVTATVWNVGDNDQDEVSVYVTNKELGLTEDVAAGDIDAFDNSEITFTISVPSNVAEKTYPVKFEVYDEDSDVYQNDFDDDYSEYVIPFVVAGNCAGSSSTTATITAALQSEAQAGQDLVVKTTLTNDGKTLKTYTVNVAGYSEWANSVTSDLSTVALKAGESRDVTFTFDVSKSASGTQTFYVEALSGAEVTRQPVSVNIAPKSSLGFLSGNLVSSENLPWVIGIINVILVLIIIFVAVRVARK